MKNINWNEVEEAQEFEKVATGGYVCGITAVEDVADKEYLAIEFDIAEGPLKNYYRGLYDAKGFWGGKFIKSYKDKAQKFFKGFITAIENSNKGFKFDNDETKLKRKLVGLVLSEEEYKAKDGSIKTRLYVSDIRSVDKIKSGDFEVKPLKKLAEKSANSSNTSASGIPSDFEETNDNSDVPF